MNTEFERNPSIKTDVRLRFATHAEVDDLRAKNFKVAKT